MVGIQVGPIFYNVGTGDFLHSFFSTVAYRLEDKKWGSIYPILMNKLHKEEIDFKEIHEASSELELIKESFKKIPPEDVIWDIEDVKKLPPWGSNIASTITDLSNYYITNDGKDLFEVFETAFEIGEKFKKNVKIRSL